MSDEVRRAVVERLKSPLNINLSILYPDAAIHFLKCPSHSVIRLEPTRPDGRPGAGPRCRSEKQRTCATRPPLRWVEPVVWRVVRPERQGPSRTSAGVNRPLSTRRSSARAARASTGLAHATGGAARSPFRDPGFRSAVHPRPVARARRETDSHAAQPPRARRRPRRVRGSDRTVLRSCHRNRRISLPRRGRAPSRERDAWTTMHRRQSDIQIAHQHVTIQHDHRKISDFCPRGRTTRLSLCADHPFLRHVCLSPATWLSPACPERTPSF